MSLASDSTTSRLARLNKILQLRQFANSDIIVITIIIVIAIMVTVANESNDGNSNDYDKWSVR